MRSIAWSMYNCQCVISYDYDEVAGDIPEKRSNHSHISRCEYHELLDGKDLHDALCLEQAQVAIVHRKIAEVRPDFLTVDEKGQIILDEKKAVVGLDDNRELTCESPTLNDQEKSDLKTELEAVTDRPVKVI